MLDEILVKQCSPTLAGLKTANLFPVPCDCGKKLRDDIREFNRKFAAKGLRMLPLRYQKNGSVLLYVYRPDRLRRDLEDVQAHELLCECGYPCEGPERCIVKLVQRLRKNEEFPHEIGLFLGYPPEDVRGFIENKAEHYKCVGTWKVYGDADKAQAEFCRFKNCTKAYCRHWACGNPLDRLVVAG